MITKRVGATIAAECFDDRSPPPPERDAFRPLFAVRDRGAGRPTKRDRRQIDRGFAAGIADERRQSSRSAIA